MKEGYKPAQYDSSPSQLSLHPYTPHLTGPYRVGGFQCRHCSVISVCMKLISHDDFALCRAGRCLCSVDEGFLRSQEAAITVHVVRLHNLTSVITFREEGGSVWVVLAGYVFINHSCKQRHFLRQLAGPV